MTSKPPHSPAGGIRRAWRGFRRWRRARPFWGGLLTILAGLEIFGSTQLTLNGLTFHTGPTGFLSWVIPAILVGCGALMWFSPQQRMFYAIVGAVTAVFSLIGVNLGGFFIGMLLGLVGGGLGFAWVTTTPTPSPGTDQDVQAEQPDYGPIPRQMGANEDDRSLTDELMTEPSAAEQPTESLPQPVVQPGRHGRGAGPTAIATVLMVVTAAGMFALQDSAPAAPNCPPTDTPAPTSATPSSSASEEATARPSASATTAEPTGTGTIVDGVIEPVSSVELAAATATPTATPAPTQAAPTATAKPSPDCPVATPKPTDSSAPPRAGKRLPHIAAASEQPLVSAKPGKLTGSKVVMSGLRFEGVVELPTADGPVSTLKFTMDTAVTDDFNLKVAGPHNSVLSSTTDRLTIQGDVAFYTTRFVGTFLGVEVTLKPDLPLPEGIPITSPVPLTFTDPVIDLAYLDCAQLSVEPVMHQKFP